MNDDVAKHIAKQALGIEWENTESAARQVARHAADREQQLIDIMFQVATHAGSLPTVATEGSKRHAERMAWVAEQLRLCGFPTQPVGASWGVMVAPEPRTVLEGIELTEPRRPE